MSPLPHLSPKIKRLTRSEVKPGDIPLGRLLETLEKLLRLLEACLSRRSLLHHSHQPFLAARKGIPTHARGSSRGGYMLSILRGDVWMKWFVRVSSGRRRRSCFLHVPPVLTEARKKHEFLSYRESSMSNWTDCHKSPHASTLTETIIYCLYNKTSVFGRSCAAPHNRTDPPSPQPTTKTTRKDLTRSHAFCNPSPPALVGLQSSTWDCGQDRNTERRREKERDVQNWTEIRMDGHATSEYA